MADAPHVIRHANLVGEVVLDPAYTPPWPSKIKMTPIGYQGAARHTYTAACDGFHESEQCPPAEAGA